LLPEPTNAPPKAPIKRSGHSLFDIDNMVIPANMASCIPVIKKVIFFYHRNDWFGLMADSPIHLIVISSYLRRFERLWCHYGGLLDLINHPLTRHTIPAARTLMMKCM
jgi:hypothetical protein